MPALRVLPDAALVHRDVFRRQHDTSPGIRLLCVAVAGVDVGCGHLMRAVHMARQARALGMDARVLTFGDETASGLIEDAGIACTTYSMDTLTGGGRVAPLLVAETVDALVLDVTHSRVLGALPRCRPVLDSLRSRTGVLCVLDGHTEQLSPHLSGLRIDLGIVPYIGARTDLPGADRTLTGAEYAMLPPEFSALAPRVVRPSGNRILVTCGGSDPTRLTLSILHALRHERRVLDLRVVLGPMFPSGLVEQIRELAASMHHAIDFVSGDTSLLPHMQWCDVAVSCSGLTKYELACTGTPSILLSLDAQHAAANLSYARTGAVADLGAGATPTAIAEAVAGLLRDGTRRQHMASAAHRIADGRGATRVLTEIGRLCLC